MAAVQNGNINGSIATPKSTTRFSDIPSAVDIPVAGLDSEEAVEVDLAEHLDDPTELCQLLENEKAAKNLWITISLAYAKQAQLDHSIDILNRGLATLTRNAPKDKLSLLSGIAWLHLLKSRHAPRVLSENSAPDTKTKDHYLKEATATINEALRLNPSFPPLHLIRGVLFLLRASLALSTSTRTGVNAENERADNLRQALKCFDDALRAADGKNMMAVMGRARVGYMQGRYSMALQDYQKVLSNMPNLTDPDPRIGIGCCLWHLGYPERACAAWERAVKLSPNSKVAHALLGIYYLRESSKLPAHDPQFEVLYKKGMAEHISKAYKIDKQFPISSAILATYFLLKGRSDQMEPLARTAVEKTDVNAIASDGWYVRARHEHNLGDYEKASDYYGRSDLARGGQDRGYLPAKFGLAQVKLQVGQDRELVKMNLERFASTRNLEAMTVLGCMFAEEYFTVAPSTPKEEKAMLAAKAMKYLENVRKTWKDENSRSRPDETILLYLARLHEADKPAESMKCLNEVEAMQLAKIPEEEKPEADHDDFISELRAMLSPQLLNNIACFQYSTEEYDAAMGTFQIALDACLKLSEKQQREEQEVKEGNLNAEDVDQSDVDAIVTTIFYNLGRTYEALGNTEKAVETYEKLLARHSDYTDASTRLAYINLERHPKDEGPKALQALFQNDYSDLDVRALMGWYFHASKKKVVNLNEDQENRHYKRTLTGYDKHDLYSLTGMGNVHLAIARDMPRNTDQEREKRSKMYTKAFEFFEKAVQLDPKNAYAAQGIGIILCDDRKMYPEALQIFTKVKDTAPEPAVYTNLGHALTEVRQYQRAIDNYNIALSRLEKSTGKSDPQLNACLARTWLLKGKQDRSITALNKSLEHMSKALEPQPENPHLRFNIAFIQFQIAQLVNSAKETERTLEDVDIAIAGLDEAIATFDDVAQLKQPPYPKQALEQRAAMGKNTMRGQLNRARTAQEKYENENKEKLQAAKDRREAEIKRREEERLRKQQEEDEKARKVAEERKKIIEETEKMAEQLRAEALAREAAEWTEDSETGERVKRKEKNKGKGKGGKKRKKIDDEDGFIENDEDEGASERSVSRTPMSGASGDEGTPAADGETGGKRSRKEKPRKKRKLERKTKPAKATRDNKKYKSKETIDSDDEAEAELDDLPVRDDSEEPLVDTPKSDEADTPMREQGSDDDEVVRSRRVAIPDDAATAGAGDEEDEDEVPVQAKRKRKQLRTIADDDEEDEEGGGDDDEAVGNEALASAAMAAVEGVDDDE